MLRSLGLPQAPHLGLRPSLVRQQDLQNWTQQLVAGQITQQEFKFNVNSKKALAQLVSLKQAGLAKVSADKFTNGLVDVIVNTAVSTFL